LKRIHVEVVSAESAILSADGELIVLPGAQGDIGVMAGHSPLMAQLRPGELRVVQPDRQEAIYYVSGGFCEIQPTLVTVLADTVKRAEAIDRARVEQARAHAREMLDRGVVGIDYAEARAELARALAQLRVLEDLEHRRQRRKPR